MSRRDSKVAAALVEKDQAEKETMRPEERPRPSAMWANVESVIRRERIETTVDRLLAAEERARGEQEARELAEKVAAARHAERVRAEVRAPRLCVPAT